MAMWMPGAAKPNGRAKETGGNLLKAFWCGAMAAIAAASLCLPSWLYAKDYRFDLPGQNLKSALEQFSVLTDLQLLYSAELVEGRIAAPLQGNLNVDAALTQLLAGSALAFRYATPGTILIEQESGIRTIGSVQVIGEPGFSSNGSSDAYATEGSGRYAVAGASVGSPTPQALKDTPRALSVLGLPQMQDQNIGELGDALRWLPSVAADGYAADAVVVSVRGRPLQFYQLDGGSVVPFLADRIAGDLSAYDRVELLNGADGLGNGFVPPSGMLNLVRKRPLDHARTVIEALGGSWDHYRGMLDVSTPPVWDGRLRSRAVIAGVDRELFQDYGFQQRQSYYGVIEADLQPETLLRVGGQYVSTRGTPWEGRGLPRFVTGAIVPQARDRSFAFALPWQQEEVRSRHAFATLEQSLGARWDARLSMDQLREEREALVSEIGGDIDPATGLGGVMFAVDRELGSEYALADLRVNGRFDGLGREHRISFGLQHASYDLRTGIVFPFTLYLVDVFNFDPADYPRPTRDDESELFPTQDERNTRYGGTVALTLNPIDALDLIAAWRWSAWSSRTRLDPVWPGLPQRSLERKQGLSYLGATWALSADWNLYASWADAFSPNNGLLTPQGTAPAPTVGDNYEAGLKYASAAAADLQARLTLYRSERSNFPRQIEAEPDSVYCCYDNGGDERDRSQGVEIEITGALLPGWQLIGGYTYADLFYRHAASPAGLEDEVQRDTQLDPRTPRHALRLWTVWEPAFAGAPGLRLGAGIRTQSHALKGTRDYEEGPTRQAGYAVIDLMAGRQLGPHWSAAVNVRNLFDREYNESVGTTTFYGEPRRLTLSLRGSF